MKPTVLLDVDGVVANFVDETLRKLKIHFSVVADHDASDWPVWSMADYSGFRQLCFSNERPEPKVISAMLSAVWTQPTFAAGISPYEGALDGVKSLMEIADVYFVTSPIWTSETWTYDRALWLRTYFDIDNSHIIFTSSKHLVRGDIFIDDKPETVEKWKQHNQGLAAVWDQPYNRDRQDLQRFVSWGGLIRVAQIHADIDGVRD